MWIISHIFCLFEGHAFIDITHTTKPYQYCLRCGKIKEPGFILKPRELHSYAERRV
jgi:hypothetical protein